MCSLQQRILLSVALLVSQLAAAQGQEELANAAGDALETISRMDELSSMVLGALVLEAGDGRLNLPVLAPAGATATSCAAIESSAIVVAAGAAGGGARRQAPTGGAWACFPADCCWCLLLPQPRW